MQKRNHKRWLIADGSIVDKLLISGVFLILILMPFHALFTAWAASKFGHFDLLRIWKEVLLGLMSIVAFGIVAKDSKLRNELAKDRLVKLISLFLLGVSLMAAFGLMSGSVSSSAAAYGFIIDSRFFLLLLIILIVGKRVSVPEHWLRWVILPAAIVVAFGLLQLTVLPDDFLRHFGYGPDTLPAFQTVDNKPDLVRLQSTLRGPNPLGAYLVPIILLFVALYARVRKYRVKVGLVLVGSLLVLFGSYSRSAWVGLVLSLWFFIFWSIDNRGGKRLFLVISSVLTLAAAGSVLVLRDNNTLQNLVFHTNELSASGSSSNQQRANALKSGLNDIYHQPLGGGVGSAGPASLRNTQGSVRIAESFFLQIGQELGVIGLGLFVAIIFTIAHRLWRHRADILPRLFLACLVGLSVVNLTLHAFADDTLAYVFFGAVGFCLATKNSTKSEKSDYNVSNE